VTMLGFIILIGIVVNNAILLVHQALMDMREGGLEAREAINGAIFKRQRPIFMTTATSVFGMLPLVLFPGAGSELYRGLGSVVVGGLALSTLFTLILVPTVLSLVLEVRGKVGQRLSVGRKTLRGNNNQA
jgi:HAE1 family hydrophobic/amphiphilic exporter-1